MRDALWALRFAIGIAAYLAFVWAMAQYLGFMERRFERTRRRP